MSTTPDRDDQAFDKWWGENRLPVQKGTLRRGWRLGAEAERERLRAKLEEWSAEAGECASKARNLGRDHDKDSNYGAEEAYERVLRFLEEG